MENKEKVYLKGMTEFVLEQTRFIKTADFRTSHIPLNNLHNYANFLNQPLCISQFVACKLVEGKWKVLEEINEDYPNNVEFSEEIEEYRKAKQRCLFKGFKIESHTDNFFSVRCENNIVNVMWNASDERNWFPARGLSTIEDLTKYNLELSQTAVKTLGL